MMHQPIYSYKLGGGVEDISRPETLVIDFKWIASVLARIPRWNSKHGGAPLSDAQHMVQGADALYYETLSTEAAAHFLLHDAHEAWLQDETKPVEKLIDRTLEDLGVWPGVYKKAKDTLKLRFDNAIYAHPLLCDLRGREEWSWSVKDMDTRMGQLEASALFGVPYGGLCHSEPCILGKIVKVKPVWTARQAEAEWLERLHRYCGVKL